MADRLCSFRHHATLIGPMVKTTMGVCIGPVIATFRLIVMLIIVLKTLTEFMKLRFSVQNVAAEKMVLLISTI